MYRLLKVNCIYLYKCKVFGYKVTLNVLALRCEKSVHLWFTANCSLQRCRRNARQQTRPAEVSVNIG